LAERAAAATAAIALVAATAATAQTACTGMTGPPPDMLGREGLRGLVCRPAGNGPAVRIVTDGMMSWPVFAGRSPPVSGETALLETVGDLAAGHVYFDPAADTLAWTAPPDRRLVMSFTTNDPVTLAPKRVWVVFDPDNGTVLDTAATRGGLAPD